MTGTLGEQVKLARLRHGLSQRQLAERSAVAARTLRDLELGRVRTARGDTAGRLLVASGALCEVRVLGAVEVSRAGVAVPVRSAMEAAVLTVLAAAPGAVVATEELAAALWPATRPASWPNLIQTYVSRLRRRLAPDRIGAVPGGYRLELDTARVDAARFRLAVAEGRLEDALREWRGPLAAGLPAGVAAHPAVTALETLRLDAGRPSPPTRPRTDDTLLAVTLLGPVSASAGGTPVRLGGTLGRTVLAALADEPGCTVPVGRLIELLWAGAPPSTAREQVHTQIYRLRRALREAGAAAALETVPVGYRLRAGSVRTDVSRVHDLLATARKAVAQGRQAEAADAYRSAEALWQGPVLDGVSDAFAVGHGVRLAQWRHAVAEERIAAELECRPPTAVLAELDAMVQAHPLREELHRLRVLALYRAGRRGEALQAFADARDVLRRELGLDPSPALRELESRILTEDPAEPDYAAAQLPPCPPGFTGRGEESAMLQRFLTGRAEPVAARVAVLSGMPGIGKTALAVHAATVSSRHFPDGALYVDLGGAADRPRSPAAVLGDLLRSLGVRPAQVPDDLAGRTAALRTCTAGRRILLLLDDAADETHVEPLVLAAPGCVTLITSRSTLPGLDVSWRLDVAPLSEPRAREVLVTCVGRDRVEAEPDAVGEVVRACAGLPLALRIVAARLATRHDLAMAEVAARLRDEQRLLGELTAGKRNLRASLAATHRLLSAPAATVLTEVSRLGVGATPWVIAALLDRSADEADRVTDELVSLHMLEAAGPAGLGPRLRPHDLVRVYAAAGQRSAAEVDGLARLLVSAVGIAAQVRTTVTGGPPSALVVGLLRDRPVDDVWARPACEDPERWFAAERRILLALVRAAADCGLAEHAAALIESIASPLVRLNLLDDLAGAAQRVAEVPTAGPAARVAATLALAQVAIQRAQQSEVCRLLTSVLPLLSDVDSVTAADAWTQLAIGREGRQDIDGAVAALDRALACYRREDDVRGQWRCHIWLARIDEVHRGRFDEAHRHAQRAVELSTVLGDWRAISMSLVQLGRIQARLDELDRANRSAAEALRHLAGRGDLTGEAWCRVLAADVARRRGRLALARRLAAHAGSLAGEAGRFDAQAAATVALAEVDLAVGDPARAAATATAALRLHDRFDCPTERRDAEAVLATARAALCETR